MEKNPAKCSFKESGGALGPSYMFQETGTGAEMAKRLCWGSDDGIECPMRRTCLIMAIENNEVFGVSGGYGQRERVRIRKHWLLTGKILELPQVQLRFTRMAQRHRQLDAVG